MRFGAVPNAQALRARPGMAIGPFAARASALLVVAATVIGCSEKARHDEVVLRISASASGAEGTVLARQLERFMHTHPGVRVENQATPEFADQRHQLYVQWLNAGVGEPDVLQLDVVWTAEFADAGFVLPLDRLASDAPSFVPSAISAATRGGRLYAVPWFVDVGMLYYRTDLVPHPPRTFEELEHWARRVQKERGVPYGFVFQGARFEGLVAVYLEVLAGLGGELTDAHGNITVNSVEGRRALAFLDECIRTRVAPEAVLTWQEEQTRFAFQSGRAVFMRNWPYAIPPLRDPSSSAVAGRFSVAPMPASPGIPGSGALGGQELAINAHSAHPDIAVELVRFLTADEQMLERALVAGQLPARTRVYDDPRVATTFSASPERLRDIVLHARPRPEAPVYTEFSEALQIALHRALTHQTTVEAALAEATTAAARVLDAAKSPRAPTSTTGAYLAAIACCVATFAMGFRRMVRAPRRAESGVREQRLGLVLVLPLALVIAVVAFLPLAWTAVESLHSADLRHPSWGRPFVGFANYAEAFASPRFRQAVLHTALFVGATVFLELAVGLSTALIVNESFRGRGLVRTTVLLPWAMPTVVTALVWRLAFETDSGLVNRILARAGAPPLPWLSSQTLAWIPLIAADVWKTAPFVALLLLAGLQSIDPSLYEAARMDGAGAVQRFTHITLPELCPALFVAVAFRGLDAVRAFDLFYVLTGGGPGTATEPVSLLAYQALFQSLRFGFGAALSLLVFALASLFAISSLRILWRDRAEAS